MREMRYQFYIKALLMCILLSLTAHSAGDIETKKLPSSMTQSQGSNAEMVIPEPISWSFPDVIESARKISPNNVEGHPFNQFGLVYSLDELSALPIATMSAESLQNYADIVTHAYPDAVFRKTLPSCKSIPIEQLNATSIANVAYVSLHAINENIRKKSKACLLEIQEHMRR